MGNCHLNGKYCAWLNHCLPNRLLARWVPRHPLDSHFFKKIVFLLSFTCYFYCTDHKYYEAHFGSPLKFKSLINFQDYFDCKVSDSDWFEYMYLVWWWQCFWTLVWLFTVIKNSCRWRLTFQIRKFLTCSGRLNIIVEITSFIWNAVVT